MNNPYVISLDSDANTVNWDAGSLSAGSSIDALNDITVVGDDVYGYAVESVDIGEGTFVDHTVLYHVGTTTALLAGEAWTLIATASTGISGTISSDDTSVLIWNDAAAWRVTVAGGAAEETAFAGDPYHDVGAVLDQEDNRHLTYRQAIKGSASDGIRDVLNYTGTNLVDEPAATTGEHDPDQYYLAGYAGYMNAHNPVAEDDELVPHPTTIVGDYIYPGWGKIICRTFLEKPSPSSTFWDKDSSLGYAGVTWHWESSVTIPDWASTQLWLATPDGFETRVDDGSNLFYGSDGPGSGLLYEFGWDATPVLEDTPNGFFYLRMYTEGALEIDTEPYADNITLSISGSFNTLIEHEELSPYKFHSATVGKPIEDSAVTGDCAAYTFSGGADPEVLYTRVLPEGVWSVGSFLESRDFDTSTETHTFAIHFEEGAPVIPLVGTMGDARRIFSPV